MIDRRGAENVIPGKAMQAANLEPPHRVSEIVAACKLLNDTTARLKGAIGTLEERIGPILREAGPVDGRNEQRAESSPLARDLGDLEAELRGLVGWLTLLLSRIDL